MLKNVCLIAFLIPILFLYECSKVGSSPIKKNQAPVLTKKHQFSKSISQNLNKKENVPFDKYLTSLSKKNINSIKVALDKSITVFGDTISKNDQIVRKFTNFYNSVISEMDDKEHDYNKNDLFKNGIRRCPSEAGDFYDESPDFLFKNLSPFVSEELKEYLKIRRNELRQTNTYLLEDAGLSISWDQLSGRIIAWEKYSKKFPQSPETTSIISDIKEYLQIYTASTLDNSPVFISESEKKSLNPEVKASYEKFLAKDSTSNSAKIIIKYYDLLKKNDFNLSRESIAYLKSQSIDVEELEKNSNLAE